MTVVTRNPRAAQAVPPAPRKPDGTAYRYELIDEGGERRAYADTAAELVELLVPGYLAAAPAERRRLRVEHAERTRPLLQRALTLELGGLERCTPEERRILEGTLPPPPTLTAWTAAVPLVLVEAGYSPFGPHSPPLAEEAIPGRPGGLLWLCTEDEGAFLRSLHVAGLVHLSERSPASGPSPH